MTSSRTGPLLLIVATISGWVLVRSLFLVLSAPGAGPPPMVFADAAQQDLTPLWPLPSFDAAMPSEAQLTVPPLRQPQALALLSQTAALAHGRRRPLLSASPALAPIAAGPIIPPHSGNIVAAQSSLLSRMLVLRPHGARPLGYGASGLAGPGRLPAFIPARRMNDNRWTLSAGLYVRRGVGGTTLGPGLPLGGSQAWARVGWQPEGAAPEIFARLNSAGQLGNGAEAAVGIAMRPVSGLPVLLVAERRQRVGHAGRNAFAAYAVGGTGAELRGWRLDGYGAAGVVGARRRDAFAEGSATINRPVARLGPVELSAGGGAWGAAQPGVHRVDVGPILSARSERIDGARLALDWRQRVAGSARPDSGPALTLAVDF